MTTDDGFKLSNNDKSASIQIGTLQQYDLADYDEDSAKLSNGTDLRRSRVSLAGNFLTDWQYRVEYEFVGTAGITDAAPGLMVSSSGTHLDGSRRCIRRTRG